MLPTTQDPVVMARSRLGVAVRRKDRDAVAEARQDLHEAKLQRAIEETLAAAPPLSPERRARLARMLSGGEL